MNDVIVSPHFLSTDIGSNVLKKGGNAVDAAIATNLIQGIVAPETCGIGGDLFAIVWDPEKNKPTFLDASGYAGTGVNPKKLMGLHEIPLNHPYSVTVPGAVAGWSELNKKYGSIPIEDILELGIQLCHSGFDVSEELHKSLKAHEDELGGDDSAFSFYKNNLPCEIGEKIRRPQLGKTLELLQNKGLEYFYQDEIAKSISDSVSNTLTLKDLSNYRAEWKEPLGLDIFGYKAWTSQPPTQGYLTLTTLKAYEMMEFEEFNLHQLIEIYRIFASDRDNILFDYKDKLEDFIGTDLGYIEEKIKLFNPEKSELYNFPKPHGGGTAYMNTVDKNGLGVSLIQSNFHGIGSRIGVGNYGFFLHNRGCGFNLEQQHPNFLRPGNKPLHTLSPTLWSKNDNLEFIIGTRGGRYQPQLLVQAILPYLLKSESFENIIKNPRWVIDYFGTNTSSKIKFEDISENELNFLKTKDHEVTNENGYKNAYGPISIIYKDKKDNFQGVADIRVGTEKVFSSL